MHVCMSACTLFFSSAKAVKTCMFQYGNKISPSMHQLGCGIYPDGSFQMQHSFSPLRKDDVTIQLGLIYQLSLDNKLHGDQTLRLNGPGQTLIKDASEQERRRESKRERERERGSHFGSSAAPLLGGLCRSLASGGEVTG